MKSKWIKALITLLLCFVLATLVQCGNQDVENNNSGNSSYESDNRDAKNAFKAFLRGLR